MARRQQVADASTPFSTPIVIPSWAPLANVLAQMLKTGWAMPLKLYFYSNRNIIGTTVAILATGSAAFGMI